MKQYTEWNVVSTSYDSLTLYRLTEKTVLGKKDNQYPFITVYNQKIGFSAFREDTLSKPQWYKRFNTRVDFGEEIRVTWKHKALLEYVAQELNTQTFYALTEAEHLVVREESEERYLSYAFLSQSGIQNGNLKLDLQNDFTTGDNRYPKNRQQTMHLLEKYSKTVVQRTM